MEHRDVLIEEESREAMNTSAATLEISILLSDELLQRLERVPGPEGEAPGCATCDRPPTVRYRFRRDLLHRLADLAFAFPAAAEKLLWKSVRIPVDLNRDREWLPLVTHRMLPRPAEQLREEHEGEQLIANVASALVNLGAKSTEAKRIAKESYQSGDTFDALLKKSLGSGRG